MMFCIKPASSTVIAHKQKKSFDWVTWACLLDGRDTWIMIYISTMIYDFWSLYIKTNIWLNQKANLLSLNTTQYKNV